MSKLKTLYACSACGGTTPRWLGQCPHCKAWNTLEETVEQTPASASAASAKNTRFQALAASQREASRRGTYLPFSYKGKNYVYDAATENTEPANITINARPANAPAGTAPTAYFTSAVL